MLLVDINTLRGKILEWEKIGELWAIRQYFTRQLDFLLVILLATEVTKQLPLNSLNVPYSTYYITGYLTFSY